MTKITKSPKPLSKKEKIKEVLKDVRKVVFEASYSPEYVWRPISDLPHYNWPVFLFFPRVGNEEEGYGYVTVGRFDFLEKAWIDYAGRITKPLMWCRLSKPEPPYIHPDQDEAEKAAEKHLFL